MAASFGGTTRSRQLFGVEAEHTRVTVILRVCDFFDVVKNRGCKQNSYDDKLVINSKKSQTLSGAGISLREIPAESKDPYRRHIVTRIGFARSNPRFNPLPLPDSPETAWPRPKRSVLRRTQAPATDLSDC